MSTNEASTIHLESFVLKNSLDGSIFPAGRQFGLKDDAKGAIANDLALGVLHLPRFPSEAILHLFPYHLCMCMSAHVPNTSQHCFSCYYQGSRKTYRPCASQRTLRQACFATLSISREVWEPLWRRSSRLGRRRSGNVQGGDETRGSRSGKTESVDLRHSRLRISRPKIRWMATSSKCGRPLRLESKREGRGLGMQQQRECGNRVRVGGRSANFPTLRR